MARFPVQRDGVLYLAEGGQETEIMYKHGHDLPEFAMFPLLDNARARADLADMYACYFEAAAAYGFAALIGGLDYRASPDWGAKLGYSRDALREAQFACIDFLREAAKPYASQLPATLISGVIGPRGDAYQLNRTITAADAEDYHSVQLETLRDAKVDLVCAMTFNNIPEAVGVSRAAARIGLPLALYFTLDSTSRLRSGPSVREAIEAVDAEAGDARPDFYGLNCSHPLEMEPALEVGDWFKR
ncbi:MAG TPA: homocysteine S-methyltransferase family protein, partial [Verrucomicrobiae bacterium]|nr:homocysteine S-methyltransferase family protein [Verrucomicrobiae bacterium]